jgi:two-component system response regulator NreC
LSIRILVVDDHPVVLHGLSALLRTAPDLEVVGEARNGEEAVHKVLELSPDVTILDIVMPEVDGIQALQRIRAQQPEARVLILSMHTSSDYVRAAFEAGASGYVVKDSELSDLIPVVRAIDAGETYLSPTIARIVLDTIMRKTTAEPAAGLLSPREKEILQCVARGKSSKEIAEELGLKARTVDTHRGNIMKKVGIHTTAGLVRCALRIGLVSTDNAD